MRLKLLHKQTHNALDQQATYRVGHVARVLSRAGAGVSSAAWGLGHGQASLGNGVRWLCLEDESWHAEFSSQPTGGPEVVTAVRSMGPRQLVFAPHWRGAARSLVASSDVLHVHGIWSGPLHVAAAAARRCGKPYVVTPHGMLEPWALRHRKWRKQIASLLVERRFLQRAACLHALVPSELRDIRRFGIRSPIAVVPNGIDLAPFDQPRRRQITLANVPQSKKLAIFLSRLHPKKGLPNLLRAWARLGDITSGWSLVIAGPDEDGHRRELEALSAGLGLGKKIGFVGPVYGEDKHELLRRGQLFVLPSHSEGFSVAVLEAMAARLPVLITDKCNFQEVEAADAGEVTPCTTDAIACALARLLRCNDQQRQQMGNNGRLLVEGKYTWQQVAMQMQLVYRWIMAGGTPPACVHFESDPPPRTDACTYSEAA